MSKEIDDKTKKYSIDNKAKKEGRKSKKNDDTAKTKKIKTKTKTKAEKPKKKHPRIRLAIKIFFILAALGLIVLAGIVASIFFGFWGDDFTINEADLTIENTRSYVYDRDENVIATLNGAEKRQIISFEEIPKNLTEAFTSIEDERFYEHNGVDFKRTAAATLGFVFKGDTSFGGSTITQQLVKNITKKKDESAERKVKEMAKAMQIEKMRSKDQILELYLNILFMGDNIYGVELASQFYFNKSAKDLSLTEAAFLAGITHTPNSYNPFGEKDNKEKIQKRTKIVLLKMFELNKITQEEYDLSKAQVEAGIEFNKGKTSSETNSYFVDATIKEFSKHLMNQNGWSEEFARLNIYGGGYHIYTTQNTTIQAAIEEQHNIEKNFITSKKTGQKTSAATTVIDYKTGQVMGIVGGRGEKTESLSLNMATQLPRQTGSVMKPLSVYAPAIEKGTITSGSVYDDVQTTFSPNYKPKNYYTGFRGLSTTRYAIEISQNIVPLKILTEMGVDYSMKFLQDLGITTLVTDAKAAANDYGIAALGLGGLTNGATSFDMAVAYGTIANNGEYIEPIFYTKILDKNGNVFLEPVQAKRRVMSESNAFIMKDLLRQPVVGSEGTATYCAISGMDVAAKTGTTNDDMDRWLCGFTDYYSAATWYGYEKKETVYQSGRNPAGVIWSNTMKNIHKGLEGKRFAKPSNIISGSVCRDSGLKPTDLCSNDPRGGRVISDVYVQGTVPSKTCDVHVQALVAHEDNKWKLTTAENPNARNIVFITRPAKTTTWSNARDAAYMLPTETSTYVAPPVTPVIPPVNNTVNNTTNNVVNNSTVNNSVTNNTTNNSAVNNSVNNTINNTVVNNTVNTTP